MYQFPGRTTMFGIIIPVLIPLYPKNVHNLLIEGSDFYSEFGIPLVSQIAKFIGFQGPQMKTTGISTWLVMFEKLNDSVSVYKGFVAPEKNVWFIMGMSIEDEEDLLMTCKNKKLEYGYKRTIELIKDVGKCTDPWSYGLRPKNATRLQKRVGVTARFEINTRNNTVKASCSKICFSLFNVLFSSVFFLSFL